MARRPCSVFRLVGKARRPCSCQRGGGISLCARPPRPLCKSPWRHRPGPADRPAPLSARRRRDGPTAVLVSARRRPQPLCSTASAFALRLRAPSHKAAQATSLVVRPSASGRPDGYAPCFAWLINRPNCPGPAPLRQKPLAPSPRAGRPPSPVVRPSALADRRWPTALPTLYHQFDWLG